MQRIRDGALSALEHGDHTKFAEFRCVSPASVSEWRNSVTVLGIVEDAKIRISEFQHFQPSHANVIARHFRKRAKLQDWTPANKAAILATVKDCEQNGWTVEQLREQLKGGQENAEPVEGVFGSVQELIDAGMTFGTVYADPPWKYGNQKTRAATGNHYNTISVKDLCDSHGDWPIHEIAAEDAHLHLWTTNSFLREAFDVIAAWGFEYRSCFVWVKPQLGIGNYWRVSHEFLLLGVRGNAKRFRDKTLASWVQADRTEHSKKPGRIRGMIEKASPGPYVELFGREKHPGWAVVGNQVSNQKRFA